MAICIRQHRNTREGKAGHRKTTCEGKSSPRPGSDCTRHFEIEVHFLAANLAPQYKGDAWDLRRWWKGRERFFEDKSTDIASQVSIGFLRKALEDLGRILNTPLHRKIRSISDASSAKVLRQEQRHTVATQRPRPTSANSLFLLSDFLHIRFPSSVYWTSRLCAPRFRFPTRYYYIWSNTY